MEKLQRNPKLAFQKLGDQTIILDSFGKNKIHQLNGVGSFLWDLFDGSLSKQEIVNKLIEEYEVSENEANTDVDEFISELKQHELI